MRKKLNAFFIRGYLLVAYSWRVDGVWMSYSPMDNMPLELIGSKMHKC